MLSQRVGLFLREPLLHFLFLGTAIFGLSHYVDERTRFTRIAITQEQIRALAENYKLQYGRSPTAPQVEAIVGNFVKEEILYRQALKLGLDVNDTIIRRRLVQKYEFLQQDLAMPSEPAEAQLRAYYRQYADRYVLPEAITFTHVYFSTDARGDGGAREAARAIATFENRRGATRAVDQGDEFPGQTDYSMASRDELARAFGTKGLTDAIFSIQLNRWSAPLHSAFGWHTVYVTDRHRARAAPFAEVRERVRLDYLNTERDRANSQAFEKLRATFQVMRE